MLQGRETSINTALHRVLEAVVAGLPNVVGIEPVGLHQRRAGPVEGKGRRLVVVRKEIRDDGLDMRADWTDVMGGLLFIRSMRPNTAVPQEPLNPAALTVFRSRRECELRLTQNVGFFEAYDPVDRLGATTSIEEGALTAGPRVG